MELKLDRKEIEAILLAHVNGIIPNAPFNRVEWDGYRSPSAVSFDHTDLPPEKEDE